MAVVAAIDRQVAAALRRAGYANAGITLVVGVSGGPDSSTLLYSLRRLSPACGLRLHIAHLNHDFRGAEADADAHFVAALAAELGLPVSVEKQDPIAYQQERRISSFEQGAREMRYAFLAAVAERVGAAAVAVGHTADDLAETTLLHLLRGAGLAGLRGMTEVAPWPWPVGLPAPALFRPLLTVAKADTAAYCRELSRDFRQDSGNALFRFTRNRVRQELMPYLAAEYNPRVREALTRLAGTAALDLDYLERETERVWPQVVAAAAPAGRPALTFDRAALAELHPALQRRLLRQGYVTLAGDARRLRESHISAMAALAAGGDSGLTLDLPAGLQMRVDRSQLILYRRGETLADAYPSLAGQYRLPWPAADTETAREIPGWRVTQRLIAAGEIDPWPGRNSLTAYLNLAALGRGGWIRSRRPGDRFQPLGMAGFKKLQDFFTDARIPRHRRDGIPLLVTERGIAWVIGQRIAEWAKIPLDAPPDFPVLELRFERLD